MNQRFGISRPLGTTFLAASLATMLLASSTTAAPEIPGRTQQQPIALVGGTVHPASGPIIEGGVLLFEDGKIIAVGRDVAIPENAMRVDCTDQHIYPGLIDAYTDLGLIEVAAVRATRDQQESGQINPNVRAQVAVNPDSELIPVARAGGVLTALTAPTGSLIAGTSALIHLDGWTYEDMTLKAPIGMHIRWPRMAPQKAWWIEESEAEQVKSQNKNLVRLREVFDEARRYWTAKKAAGDAQAKPKTDLRWEAMIPVFERQLPLIVSADSVAQIQSAVAFARRENVRLIVLGGYDAPRCTELLKEYDVPVIVGATHRLPEHRMDDYDAAFRVPADLHAAGVRFCIASSGRATNVRNLPHNAGSAAAYGLPPEEALRSVTLYPAQIFGVDDVLGSLEAGKHATLIVTDGDVLEVTSRVEKAYIQGRSVQLSNRHTRLYEKYREKYRRLGYEP